MPCSGIQYLIYGYFVFRMGILRTRTTVISLQTWQTSSMQVMHLTIAKMFHSMLPRISTSFLYFFLSLFSGQAMNITNLNVRSMLPDNLGHFFRYQGSLTTPPCHESILWTVFDTPITLSHNQVPTKVLMKKFSIFFCFSFNF